MTLYCSLAEAQLELDTLVVGTGAPTVDDRRLLTKIRSVSQRVDQMFPQPPEHWPMFAPWNGTHLERITPFKTNSRSGTLALTKFLLALTGDVTLGGLTVAAAAYPDANYPPFKRLRKTDCCLGWYDYCQSCCDPPWQASIPGIWGFHSDYANAWMNVDAVVTPALMDTTQTTFTVADADGVDLYGVAPRLSIGNLIRIDSEYMEVGLADPVTNTLTVRRGVNGSVAATHAVGAVVSTWQVEPVVKTAVARQAAFQYERRGAFVSVEVQGMGEVRYPNDWLAEVYGALQGYANE